MTEQAQYISGRTVQEQMDNLIKYVDDRSKTVAEGEAQRVLVPAEAAKVAAEAAADRAESSVGQFETRLQGAEDGVAGNRSSIQTIDGEITDIYNDLTNVVRKVGEAGQVIANGLDLRGTNRASNTTIGQNDNQIANGKRVIDELAAYEPMVRTTGNQIIEGVKTFNGTFQSSGYYNNLHKSVPFIDGSERWYKVYEYDGSGAQYHTMMFTATPRRTWPSYAGIGLFINNRNSSPVLKWMVKGENLDVSNFIMTKEGGNAVTIWCKGFIGSADGYQFMRLNEYASSGLGAGIYPVDDGNGYEITSSGYEDNDGVQHTFTMYKVSE